MKPTVLVIDDDPMIAALIVSYLQKREVTTIFAENGQLGLEKASNDQPALILMDVMMPVIDGFETCRQLKLDEKTQGIPVIFMTSLTATKDKVKGFDAGGVDYITKPLEADEVWARIKTHLTISRLQQELQKKNRDLESEISIRIKVEKKQAKLIKELQETLAENKVLRGILPLCSFCKKIRTDDGYWEQVDVYLLRYSDAQISHSLCPECVKEHYPDFKS